jgi:hypothetical protein
VVRCRSNPVRRIFATVRRGSDRRSRGDRSLRSLPGDCRVALAGLRPAPLTPGAAPGTRCSRSCSHAPDCLVALTGSDMTGISYRPGRLVALVAWSCPVLSLARVGRGVLTGWGESGVCWVRIRAVSSRGTAGVASGICYRCGYVRRSHLRGRVCGPYRLGWVWRLLGLYPGRELAGTAGLRPESLTVGVGPGVHIRQGWA